MKTGPRDRSPHTLGQLLWQKLQPPSDWHMGMSSMSHTSIWAGRFTDHHTDSAIFSGVKGIQVFVSGFRSLQVTLETHGQKFGVQMAWLDVGHAERECPEGRSGASG